METNRPGRPGPILGRMCWELTRGLPDRRQFVLRVDAAGLDWQTYNAMNALPMGGTLAEAKESLRQLNIRRRALSLATVAVACFDPADPVNG